MRSKNLKRVVALIVVISSLFASPMVDAVGEATVSEIQEAIDVVEVSITETDKNMEIAHNIADYARELGVGEDDMLIVRAKELWEQNKSNNDELRVKCEYLRDAKYKLEQFEARRKLEQSADNRKLVGEFKLTGYCSCSTCSEGYGTSTASGNKALAGVTIAADPKVLPLGTRVYIEGVGERVVQDIGGSIKGNRIDIYVDTHSECYSKEYNQQSVKVYKIT